jgi:ATP-dependent DNA helicase DinG
LSGAVQLVDSDDVIVSIRKGAFWTVETAPLDVGPAFRTKCLDISNTVVLTSGTLFLDGGLDHLCDLLSTGGYAGTAQVSGPFDLAKQLVGFVCSDVTKTQDEQDGTHLQFLARSINLMSIATHGRTLVLFSNYAQMKEVASLCAPVLERHGIRALTQNGTSEREIALFRADTHSVLFGVRRFWSGVDFPGETLSQLIITTLGQQPPSSPEIAARKRRAYRAGDGAVREFWQFYSNLTRHALVQAFGRPIRSMTDIGTIVLLDDRPVRKHSKRCLLGQSWDWHAFEPTHDGYIEVVRSSLAHLGLSPELASRGLAIPQMTADLLE